MKKILLLTVLGIAVVQMLSAQSIEVVGNGVLNETSPTLTIPDLKTVDYVVVEAAAIFKYGTVFPPPTAVFPKPITFSTKSDPKTALFITIPVQETKAPGGTWLNSGTNPYFRIGGQSYSLGYYTEKLFKTEIKPNGPNGIISLNKNGQGRSIITFFAYVYRTNGTVNKLSIISNPLNRAFVYLNGANDPIVREFTMPTGTGPRNIEVAVPLSDGDDIDERLGVITLFSGNQKTDAKVFKLNGLGKNFHVERVMLYNVPKEVTYVKIEIYSPTDLKKGDSFIVGLPVLTVQGEEDCAVCKGGVTALKLEYIGNAKNQTISIYTGKVDKKNLLKGFPMINVNKNNFLDFIGNEKDKTMGTKIIIEISDATPGSKKNYTEIHTSCSKDIYAGMQFGDFKIASGTSKYGGPLCPYVEPPCRDCKGGVTALELKYTGTSTSPVTINIYKGKVDTKNLLKGPLVISTNDIFTFLGNEKNGTMGSNIIITIPGQKNTEIHTSCSKPIYPGMTFGDFEIVSGTSKDGGPLCPGDNGNCAECKGGVTELLLKYTGPGIGLSVTNKTGEITAKFITADPPNAYKTILISNNGYKLGTNINIKVDGKTTALHTSCSQPIYVGMTFVANGSNYVFEILSGKSKYGGPLCPKEPGGNGACICEGGVDHLAVDYSGTNVVKVTNSLKVGAPPLATINPNLNGTGQNILIDNGANKLGTNIYFIFANGTSTALHTSCSQPLWVGKQFGGLGGVFTIVGGASFGGPLCNVPYNKKKSAMIENMETIAEIHEFGVYPNPVLNTATVSFMPAYDGLATVELYNSLGQKAGSLLHQSVNKDVPVSFTFSGHKFKEGLYILILQNGDYRETAKIQISR